MRQLLLTLSFLLFSLAATASPKSEAADRARAKEAISSFIAQQAAALPGKIHYQIEEIDPRVTLPNCAGYEAFLPSGSQLGGKTPIGVRCAAAPEGETRMNSWSMLIPVQIRFRVSLLTSARQLPPGHTLQAEDIARQETEVSRLEGFTDDRQVIGKVLRYGISAGQMLREDMLRQPYSVKQGQVVPLAVRGEGFSIRSEGVALSNVSEGQTVQIRVGSGRVVSGVARGDGTVEIAP